MSVYLEGGCSGYSMSTPMQWKVDWIVVSEASHQHTTTTSNLIPEWGWPGNEAR